MMLDSQIAGRLFLQPLLMDRAHMTTFLYGFANRDGLSNKVSFDSVVDQLGNEIQSASLSNKKVIDRKNYQMDGGVALISVSGTLVNKSGYVGSRSGMMGYDGLEVQFAEAIDDPDVKSILFDLDSGGGEVAGCFDFCDMIYEHRHEKPIVAFVGERAYSACYAIASACSEVIMPRTGGCGSVGVLTAHTDFSKALSKQGVKVTLIHSGDKKVDGNPYESLPKDVRDDIQSRIDETRQIFASSVARNRGMSVDAILATEAATYNGQAAVDVGFADRIMTYNEVLAEMNDRVLSKKSKTDASSDSSSGATAGRVSVDELSDDTVAADADVTVDTTDQAVDEAATGEESDKVSDFGAAEISTMCSTADMAHLIPSFIENAATEQQVADRIDDIKELRNVLCAAGFSDASVSTIEKCTDMASLSRAILDASVSDDADIDTIVPEPTEDDDATAGHDFYGYAKR